jgi:hypothetical protein
MHPSPQTVQNRSGLSRIELFAESLNSRPGLLLTSYSIITLVITFGVAMRRPTWVDEIFTIRLSSFNSFGELLAALQAGMDVHPPLSYMATHALFSVAGNSVLVSRIPAMLGFWLMGLFAYRYVSFRYTPLWGIAAALFPFVTSYYYFAAEARPYGIVLGATAIAMASWQSAASGVRRRISLVVLVLAILVIVCSHYYGLLVIIPLFVGELTRTILRRKADWPVIISSLFPFGAVVVFLPLIHVGMAFYGAHPWNPPSITNLLASYSDLGSSGRGVAGLALFMVLAGSFLLKYPFKSSAALPVALPPLHETAAAFGFLLLPVAGYLIAIVKTHGYLPRYVIPILLGYTLLFGFAAAHLFVGRAIYAIVVNGILLLGFLVNGAVHFRNVSSQTEGCPVVPAAGPLANLPVVMANAVDYVRCDFYASPELKSKMVFVADPVLSMRYVGFDVVDKELMVAKDVVGLHVVRFDDFRGAYRQLLLVGMDRWVGRHYLNLGAKIELLPNGLYLVTDAK